MKHIHLRGTAIPVTVVVASNIFYKTGTGASTKYKIFRTNSKNHRKGIGTVNMNDYVALHTDSTLPTMSIISLVYH